MVIRMVIPGKDIEIFTIPGFFYHDNVGKILSKPTYNLFRGKSAIITEGKGFINKSFSFRACLFALK